MDFTINDEQRMVVETARDFVDRELAPFEEEVERANAVSHELAERIKARAIEAGIYAANMPVELGGGGLDNLTLAMFERALGTTGYALQYLVARPSNILQACEGEQVERYLLPTIRGERVECLAMSEPDAGSDLRGMRCRAVREGGDFSITGTKHFISHADHADYAIVFAATGEEETSRGSRALITAFLVDMGTPGFEVGPGYASVSHRGYLNAMLNFDGCRIPASQILGQEHGGIRRGELMARRDAAADRRGVPGRADRAIDIATDWAVERRQFGQQIGKFQGVSFKLADMALRREAAEMLTYRAAWRADQGMMTDTDAAMAKLSASEMLAFVTDEAIQILGGMGLMEELPLERMWRDARVERIWDGTSEIQRHIISRAMLRPLGG